MISLKRVEYEQFIRELTGGVKRWVILGSVNFEECSIRVCRDILQNTRPEDASRLLFYPFRLVSGRGTPWSALEIVKDQLQAEIMQTGAARGLRVDVAQVESPVREWQAFELLSKARGNGDMPTGLVLDISALPRDLAVYLCDMICGLNTTLGHVAFEDYFVVQTPPERVTSRQGLGPFSVGAATCVYRGDWLRSLSAGIKISMLLFPGYEGFEAALAADSVLGHNARVLMAVGCFESSFPAAMEVLIANQSLLADAVERSLSVDVQYYFSETDALRVACSWVDRALQLCAQYPQARHAFLAAPFGPKWSVFVSSLARREFLTRCTRAYPNVEAHTDVVVMPRSQYVSLYSRGARIPCVFKLQGQP